MANYPTAARNIAARAHHWIIYPRLYSASSRYAFAGRNDETAVEDLIGFAIADYTKLADSRTVRFVRTWKILGAWPQHDSDITVAVTSGSRPILLNLKVLVDIKGTAGTKWRMEIREGGFIRVDHGTVSRSPGRTLLAYARSTPRPVPEHRNPRERYIRPDQEVTV